MNFDSLTDEERLRYKDIIEKIINNEQKIHNDLDNIVREHLKNRDITTLDYLKSCITSQLIYHNFFIEYLGKDEMIKFLNNKDISRSMLDFIYDVMRLGEKMKNLIIENILENKIKTFKFTEIYPDNDLFKREIIIKAEDLENAQKIYNEDYEPIFESYRVLIEELFENKNEPH